MKKGEINLKKTHLENQAIVPSKDEERVEVDPTTIVVDESKNFRIKYDDIEELSESIVASGLKNAVKCRMIDGKLHLAEGFRRMRAINLALKAGKNIAKIPVLIIKKQESEEERVLNFWLNNNGKPYTMIEQAGIVKSMLTHKWEVKDISKATGKARGYVDNLVLLTQVPMEVHKYIVDEKISAHAVIQIMQAIKFKKGDEAKLLEEVKAAMQNAAAAGKTKATPKHVGNKKVKSASHGKFYKHCEALLEAIMENGFPIKDKVEIVEKLLLDYENGLPAKQAARFFTDLEKLKKAQAQEKSNGKK